MLNGFFAEFKGYKKLLVLTVIGELSSLCIGLTGFKYVKEMAASIVIIIAQMDKYCELELFDREREAIEEYDRSTAVLTESRDQMIEFAAKMKMQKHMKFTQM